ncbi:MAG: 6-phosphofructokinase [Halanaerobium sp.]|nr:6-phosphofructokinase [Halanaerobium sp.]
MKRIGVLTSGGDAPGMNAAIRAVVRTGIYEGLEVYGIKHGYSGLIKGDIHRMNRGSVADVIHRGGTVLQTARSEEFKTVEGRKKALAEMEKFGLEGLIIIGGDGSFRGAMAINEELAVPSIGIPATIDNDIACTDYSIGFDTAMNTIIDTINKIRDTATSHERTFVIETMGRNSGLLTLFSGLAGGAESIIIPEVDFTVEQVCEKLEHGYRRGKLHSIILVAEGIGGDFHTDRDVQQSKAFALGKEIEKHTGMETRIIILGHLQRGGSPTALDRIIASQMGAAAVRLLEEGEEYKMVGWVNHQIKSFGLPEVLSKEKKFKKDMYELANILSL